MAYDLLPASKATPGELLAVRPHIRLDERGIRLSGVALAAIAAGRETPIYVYDAGELAARCAGLKSAFARHGLDPLIAYPLKANDTQSVIQTLADQGCGADIVSGGEARRAIAAGISPKKIVFSGVGKTANEIRFALANDFHQINVESAEELRMVAELAAPSGRKARICLRLNPDVDAGTIPQITTGVRHSKFGIAAQELLALAETISRIPLLELVGVSVHAGSQISEMGAFSSTFRRLEEVLVALRRLGFADLTADVGGGLAIPYEVEPALDIDAYAGLLAALCRRTGSAAIVEPGRWLVGRAGTLLCRVIRQKIQGGRRQIVVDAGMNDLVRPAMYQVRHAIVPVDAARYSDACEAAEVVGPVCESSDSFGLHLLPPVEAGELLALLDAGAYGATMSSFYNTRMPPAAVIIANGGWRRARRRMSVEELIALDAPELCVRSPSILTQSEVF